MKRHNETFDVMGGSVRIVSAQIEGIYVWSWLAMSRDGAYITEGAASTYSEAREAAVAAVQREYEDSWEGGA